jgi:hypothetical protein
VLAEKGVTLVLHTLGFPDELAGIPHHSEDWHYESGADMSLIDIVILALNRQTTCPILILFLRIRNSQMVR